MNTTTEKPICSAANAHEEPPAADIKPRYRVVLHRTKTYKFTVYIEASSRFEAAMRAEINAVKELPDCECSGDCCACPDCPHYEVFYKSVDVVEGGQENE